MKEGVPAGMQCISFPYYGPKGYIAWDKLIRQHEPLTGDTLRDPNEPGTLIYTSGSTGTPKGVMHKIYNFSYASHRGISYLGLNPGDRFFSYLPLAHIGERLFVEMGVLYSGGEVWFAESIDKFQDNIRTAAPTVFLGVHRIWKKFQEGILSRLSESKLNLLLKIPLISGILKNKIKKGLGLHEAKNVFTSAAPTPVDLILWFRKIGIHIGEGYAMTENFAYSHASLMHEARPGYVGHPLPGVEVRFGDDGEIQIKHPALMDGYYKDPELTRETLTEDGYLRTGDKGEADAEGYLKITGRTKEIFKTSKGKYVVPNTIEMKVGSHQDIEMSCVTGISLPQPIILITLSETGKKKDQSQMAREIAEHIQRINAQLDAHEKIQKVVILDENWTIDNNMLTPTLKLKRKKVEEKYENRFGEWYNQEPFVVTS
jgi:long-subunit acyl-CoA synthetase (AMP-forming)